MGYMLINVPPYMKPLKGFGQVFILFALQESGHVGVVLFTVLK